MGGLYSKNARFSPVAVLYLLLLLPAYWPLLTGKVLYQGDIFIYFEPLVRYITSSLGSGRLPLWNPLIFCGSPQSAISSPGLFYPPNLLFLLLPFGYAFTLAMLLHQWLFGIATFLFLRTTATAASAAFFGGAVALLCGYMFGSSQCYTLAATFAWTPLVLYLLRSSIASLGSSRHALASFVIGVQILAGRPEIFLSSLLIYALYALTLSNNKSEFDQSKGDASTYSQRLQWLAKVALAMALGLAMAAVSLLPMSELYSVSPRISGLDFSELVRWSAGWFDWLQVILIQPFGDLVVANYHLNPHYPGLYPYISSLYLGAPVVTFALLGWMVKGWSQRLFWLLILVTFFFLASGEFGFFIPLWYKLAPQTLVFRYPVKLAIVPVFALVMAAAVGFKTFQEGAISRKAGITVAALWLVAAVFALEVMLDIGGATSSLVPSVWRSRVLLTHGAGLSFVKTAAAQLLAMSALGLVTVLAACLSARSGSKAVSHKLAFALSALCLVPMIVSGALHLWHYADSNFYDNQSEIADWLKSQPDQTAFRHLALLPDDLLAPRQYWDEKDLKQNSVSTSRYERQVLQPDVNMAFNLPSSYGFGPTETNAFHALFMGVTTRSLLYAPQVLLANRTASDVPLACFCQITNSGYVFTATTRPDARTHVIEDSALLDAKLFDLKQVFPKLNLRVYKVKQALPRAYFRRQWTPVETQREALSRLFYADRSYFHAEEDVLINNEGDWSVVPNPPPVDLDHSDTCAVSIVRDNVEEIEVAVKTSEDGFLVLSDLAYPGWEAFDNTLPKRIYEANGFLRAVWLEPGEHKVIFRYRPKPLAIGAMLSLASLIAMSLWLFLTLRSGAKR